MDMTLKTISCFILLLIGCVRSFELPVGKCNLENSACMIAAFQKFLPDYFGGIPELGIEVQDTLVMDDIKFDLAGLQFFLSGGLLSGLKNSVIDDVKWNVAKKFFKVIFHFDGTVTGHYTAAGKVIILPITGDGEMTLKAKNLQLTLVIPYEIKKGKDNKDYIAPKKIDFEYKVKDNTHFDLTNLFNGDKELSDAMLRFLNENWQEVSTEFGRPIIEGAFKKVLKNLVTFFRKQAITDIADI